MTTQVIRIGDADQPADFVHVEPGRNRELARLRYIPADNGEVATVDIEITAREGGEIIAALVKAFLTT